jgi:hypothetical protein
MDACQNFVGVASKLQHGWKGYKALLVLGPRAIYQQKFDPQHRIHYIASIAKDWSILGTNKYGLVPTSIRNLKCCLVWILIL